MTTPTPPAPTNAERADTLRTVYRYFRMFGIVCDVDKRVLDTAIAELTALGYVLNSDETDWQPATGSDGD